MISCRAGISYDQARERRNAESINDLTIEQSIELRAMNIKPRKRRFLQFSLRFLLLITLLCTLAAFYFGRKLNVQNFDRVKVGMTQKDVEHLLGGAPGHYGRRWGPGLMTLEGFFLHGRREEWTNDDTMLEVIFDGEGIVIGKHRRAGYGRSSLIRHWLMGNEAFHGESSRFAILP